MAPIFSSTAVPISQVTEAYVTLATNDRYALGALVLAHSLRRVQTTRQLCILITPGVTDPIRSQLNNAFDAVINVDVMDSNDSAHLALLKRPELGVTFTKIHCWTLIQYTKCVFLDADILAIQNSDELFDQPELSAACDIGWPDCFNSGMFVFVPSLETYTKLLQHAEQTGSFDGGDQGLLNTFFTNWTRLSFVYNMVASVTYTYLPAYKQYGSGVKFVHFLGATKPWEQRFHSQSGTVVSRPGQEHISSHLNTWWSIYSTNVKSELPEAVSTVHPPEVTSSDQEFKHSQEAHETESIICHTQSTHIEHTPIYHDHQEQVIKSIEEHKPVCDSHEWIDRSHTRVDTPSCYVDSQQTHVDSSASHIKKEEESHTTYVVDNKSHEGTPILTQHQQEVTEQNRHFLNKDTQINVSETKISPHKNIPPLSSPPSAANDSRSDGKQHEVSVTNVSDARRLADFPYSIHCTDHASLATDNPVELVRDPISESRTTHYPQSSPIPSSPQHQPSHPNENEVPELKKFTSEAETVTMQPALWAGRRARVPFPPSLDAPFQPLVNHRIPSPFSGYRTARAVSAKGPLKELADQLTGLNVSESLEEGRRRWEEGVPDFRGRDSFENILAHIDSKLNE